MAKLSFTIHEQYGDANFVMSGMDGVTARLDNLLERYERGRLGLGELADKMDALIDKQPLLIDAYVHKGYALYEAGYYRKALEAYRQGVAVGEKVIPADFKLKLIWGALENRPFLRALHGYGLCCLALGNVEDGKQVLKRLLAYNPGDNQGARYILASLSLRHGTSQEAEESLVRLSKDMVPADLHFDTALYHFRNGNVPAAIASVRRGVLESSHIFVALVHGVEELGPAQTRWDWDEVRRAKQYVEEGQPAWAAVAGAQEFLDWLSEQPQIRSDLQMRARYDAVMEGDDFNKRAGWMTRQQDALKKVSPKQGEAILEDAGVPPDHDWSSGAPSAGFHP